MNRCFHILTLLSTALFTCLLTAGAALSQFSDGKVAAQQKISATEGNFTSALTALDRFCFVAPLGDLNGDGVEDVAVGAYGDDDGGDSRGAVWILFLDPNGTVKSHQKISDTQGNFTGALSNSDLFGLDVTALGDLDNDGITDLAVGASRDDDGSTDRGAVWILLMNSNGTVKSNQKISDTAGNFAGSLSNSDFLGEELAALGDLDGDGVEDLAVSAPRDDDGDTDRGAVWILFLNTNGTVKSYQKISDTEGNFTGTLDNSDWFGQGLEALGDLDGDGVGDLAVGAINDDDGGTDRGAVWILFMNSNGTVKSHQKISDTEGNFAGILDDGDTFGRPPAGLGDLDGDGVEDVAVSACGDDDGGANQGAVWVLFLNSNGTVKSYQKISETEGGFTGALDNDDGVGIHLANIGDLNGDSITDLAVGALTDDDGGDGVGAVWILFMHSTTFIADAGPNRSVNFGQSITIGGTSTANGGAAPYTYSWSPATGLSATNIANPTAGPASTTTYTVTVTDFNNVTDQDEVVVTVNGSSTANLTSFFDSDAEGWIAINNTTGTPTYSASGGNPGGYIRITDNLSGITWYWQAPAKFLGDVSCAYGGSLSFDLRQSLTTLQTNVNDVILVGGGLTLVFDTPSNPGTAWTSYSIPLNENAGWKVTTLTGPAPTQTEMLAVLTSLTKLQIRGEYSSATSGDRTDLDNVVLTMVNPTATVSGDATICPSGSAPISAALTGNGPWNLTWSDGYVQSVASSPATRVVSPVSTTTYTVIHISDVSCTGTSSGSATITVNSIPVVNAGADLATATGVLAKIGANPTGSGGTSPLTYLWSPSTGLSSTTVANPTATPASTTTYTVTVTDANNCAATDQITVRAGNLVNSRIKLIIGPTNVYDPDLNQVRVDMGIKNISGQPIYGPFTAVFKTLTPGPPTITIPNADGGGEGLGCYYDYSDLLGGDNILSPGETTSFKLWIFQEHVIPAVNFKFFVNVVGDLDLIPKVAADDQPLALSFDLQKATVQSDSESESPSSSVEIPKTYALHQNHPNPFNPSTTMQFDLPEAGEVTLKIYNINGQEVRTLISEQMNAGRHSINWDGKNNLGQMVPSGVYLYKLHTNEFEQTRKMTIMK